MRHKPEKKIRTDKKTMRRWKYATLITLGISLLIKLVLFATMSAGAIFDEWNLIYGISSIFICCAVLCFMEYCYAKRYLKELEIHGFEVPEDKRDFDNDVAKLPHKEITPDAEKKLRNKDVITVNVISLIGAVISAAIGIFSYIDLMRRFTFPGTGRNAAIMLILAGIAVLVITLNAVCFNVQNNKHKYRDEVENDTDRRLRSNVTSAKFVAVILLIAAPIALIFLRQICDFVMVGREENYNMKKTKPSYEEFDDN